ncbi:unnamed protein product, partial [Amoebophrya sp. A25]
TISKSTPRERDRESVATQSVVGFAATGSKRGGAKKTASYSVPCLCPLTHSFETQASQVQLLG